MKSLSKKLLMAILAVVSCTMALSAAACTVTDSTACSHVWDEGTVITEPTYTETGKKEYTCVKCGEKKTAEIEKLVCAEHDWEIKDRKEPTYTEAGYDEKICRICGVEVKEDLGKKALPVASPEKTVAAATNEELIASVKAELGGSDSVEFTLGEGSFALKDQGINTTGKTVILNGAGKDKTVYMTVYNAQKGGEYGAEYTFDGAKAVVFKNMTLDLGEHDFNGFIRPETIIFENCVIDGRLTYCGSKKAMFVNCEFNNSQYNMWLYSALSYEFYGCNFHSEAGKFLNAYFTSEQTSPVSVLLSGCFFSADVEKYPVLKIKSSAGIIWKVTVENSALGENVSEWYNMETGVNASSTVTIDGKVVWENGAKTENN